MQLLTHTAGLPDFHVGSDDLKIDLKERYKIFVQDCVNFPPINKPGTTYKYSNDGPVVVTAMLSKITGLIYEQMLQEYIIKPLGMRNTSSRPSVRAEQDPDVKLVWQHHFNVKTREAVPETTVGWLRHIEVNASCGGVNMSLMDQALLMIAHMPSGCGARLLRNDTLEVLHTVVIKETTDSNEEACPGLMRFKDARRNILGPVFHHPGTNGANYANIMFVPGVSFGYSVCYTAWGNPDGPFILENAIIDTMPNFKKK
jgi:CubicO group peptidase (beta-lactamase class C family)